MKILIIRSYASVPNANQYNLQHVGLAKAFLRKGHHCDIVYWVGKGKESVEKIETEDGSFNIHWMRGIKIEKSIIFDFVKVDKLIAQYDIVQTEEYELLFSCYLALRYPDKVVVYHGPYESEYKKRYKLKSKVYDIFFSKWLIKRKTQFIAKTNAAQQTLLNKGFLNVKIVKVGLDLSKFSSKEPEYQFMPDETDKLKLLYVGKICDGKNTSFLIDLVAALRKRDINATLTLIGAGDEYYVEACRKKAHAIGVSDYVDFMGAKNQTELESEYKQHDLFLFPTKYEVFGMVLLEALYFGCVVISSEEGGPKTILDNGKNGFLMKNFDVDEWVEQIIKIYKHEYDIECIMRNARNSVKIHYNWDESAEDFLKIYYEHIEQYN